MSPLVKRPLPRRFNRVPGNKLWWRNMQGSPTKYNKEGGKRDFSIEIPDDLAEELLNDGWTCINYKPKTSVDPDSPKIHRMKININFDARVPPKVYIAGEDENQRTLVDEAYLDEQNIDSRRIAWVNIDINPYPRDTTCTAYLSEMTIKFDGDVVEYTYGDDIEF